MNSTDKQIADAVILTTPIDENFVIITESLRAIGRLRDLAQSYLALSKQDGVSREEELHPGSLASPDSYIVGKRDGFNQARQEMLLWIVGRAGVEKIMDMFPEYLHTITIAGVNEPNIPHQQVIFKKDIPGLAQAISEAILGGKENAKI